MKGKTFDTTTLILIWLCVSIALPFLGIPPKVSLYLFIFFVYLALANSWNLLAGFSGLVSLCTSAFFGLAGYCLILLSLLRVPLWIGFIVGLISNCLLAVLIAIPTFRLSGIYFSIGTLVIPEAMRILFFLWRPIKGTVHGGGAGYMLVGKVRMETVYVLSALFGILSVAVLYLIVNSKFGLGLAAIRDNQRTAQASGINVYVLKLKSFLISASIASVAGSTFYLYQGYIEPASAFNVKWTMIAMLSTVIGGMGTVKGPIVGSAFVTFLHFLLARYGTLSLMVQGLVLIAVMLLAPQGLVGLLDKKLPSQALKGKNRA